MVVIRLKGSTMVETLIAIIIISSAFAIGLYTLARLDVVQSSGAKNQARMILQDYLNETVAAQRYFDETITDERMTIVKTVLPTSNNDIIVVKLEGYIKDKLMGMKSKVVKLR